MCGGQIFNKKYTFTICVRRVWMVIEFFLFEKQAFNVLLKVISKQIIFMIFLYYSENNIFIYIHTFINSLIIGKIASILKDEQKRGDASYYLKFRKIPLGASILFSIYIGQISFDDNLYFIIK